MLDVTVTAGAFRPSPEDPAAPVLIPTAGKQEYAAGGAANLALNLIAQGCDVQLCAPWAESSWASARLRKLVVGPPDTGVRWPSYTPGGDPWLRTSGTTTKTRYITNNRLVARVDDDHDSDPVMPPAVIVGPKPAAVILTDYGRGAITTNSVVEWSSFCRRFNIPMYADPKKGRSELWFSRYTELAAMVLNWEEAEEFAAWTSPRMSDEGAAKSMGRLIIKSHPDYGRVVLKRGIYGSILFRKGGAQIDAIPPVLPRDHVADRQGAGDTYLAAMVAAVCRGVEMPQACFIGSAAAGVAVSRPGTSVVTLADSLAALKGAVEIDANTPAEDLRRMGFVVGYTNGCFDFHLHPGHLSTIAYAASLCDFLFVGVDSDARVKKLKGDKRPVVCAKDRVAQLQAVKRVHKAFEFDDHVEALKSVRPDVLVKGEDWRAKGVPEAELLKEWGGRLAFAPEVNAPHVTDRLKAAGIE
jgi:D-beta-D-heptose 7-phosphate kinase/D-beta-D-heptose 1-phosphate adenosyltransferase